MFSESIMAQYFTSEKLKTARYGEKLYFRSRLTPMQWRERAEKCMRDDSMMVAKYDRESRGFWNGLEDQSAIEVIRSGLSKAAMRDFEKASGSIDTHFQRASPILSPVGGSFSIGRIMAGHPKAAIIRPKAKLPPKKIDLTINVWAGVECKNITASMSKIAKAAWQYIAAGGIVELTANYMHNFSRPQEWNGEKHYGLLDTVKINPVNAGAFATAASAQFYRALSIPLAQMLSGDGPHDGLPVGKWENPASFAISGNATDRLALEALRIKD
jgi:hypothetical protein